MISIETVDVKDRITISSSIVNSMGEPIAVELWDGSLDNRIQYHADRQT